MNADDLNGTPMTLPPSSPDGDLVPINPEKLTPASRRTVRNLAVVWLVSFIAIGGAFHVYDVRGRGAAACVARQYAHDQLLVGWKIDAIPMTTDGFTGEVLLSRQLANATRVARFKAKVKKLGPRPTC